MFFDNWISQTSTKKIRKGNKFSCQSFEKKGIERWCMWSHWVQKTLFTCLLQNFTDSFLLIYFLVQWIFWVGPFTGAALAALYHQIVIRAIPFKSKWCIIEAMTCKMVGWCLSYSTHWEISLSLCFAFYHGFFSCIFLFMYVNGQADKKTRSMFLLKNNLCFWSSIFLLSII